MINDHVNHHYVNEKYVVYYDENYHQSWIYPEATKQLIEYFTSEDRIHKFTKLNADDLLIWIMERLKPKKDRNVNCINTVIVFSQDMVPDKIAPDFSPSVILRKYLDNGGRIVWIGDIPFWRQGKVKKKHVEWNVGGIFSILGLNPDFNYSPKGKVTITQLGLEYGLKTPWYGPRPIQEKGGSDGLKDLATTYVNYPKEPKIIKPKGVAPEVTIKTFVSKASNLWNLLLPIFIAFGSYIGLEQNITITIISFIVTGIIVYIFRNYFKIKELVYPDKYTSAWIKNFNLKYPFSGFIRIWDRQIYYLNEEELKEIYDVAFYKLHEN